MKLKGFTMIELLTIVVIMGIIFVALRPVLGSKQQRETQAMTCVYTIYGLVRNFVEDSIKGRGIYSGTNLLFPTSFFLNNNNDEITLGYDENNLYKKVSLTTGTTVDPRCTSASYQITLSGDYDRVNISNKRFLITPNHEEKKFLKRIIFSVCNPNKNNCISIGVITFDQKSQGVYLTKCGGDEKNCLSR